LTRRELVVGGAAAAGTAAFPQLAAAKPRTVSIWRLTPEGCSGSGGGACAACVEHDEHSLFPSAKAANGNRAHIACNCCVQQGTIDQAGFNALFGSPDEVMLYRVDTRWRNVSRILRKHPASFSS
jgi:hypothetical protein